MSRIKKTVFLSLMLAVIIVLSALENSMPPLPFLPPGVRLGLSNVVIMYCVFFAGNPQAFMLVILKSFFVFITRGPFAGLLSLSGGLMSVCAIVLLILIFKDNISIAAISVAGACFHNFGQYAAAAFILSSPYLVYYLPVLIVSGVVMGLVTGAVLKIVLPVIRYGVWSGD